MPIEKNQQILAKIESTDGVSSSPSASDAVLVYEPSMEDQPDTETNKPAGATLSPATVAIGRRTRRLSFKVNFDGSGDTTIPITEPSWVKFLRGCGHHYSTLRKVTMGAVTGTGFQIGELLTQSAGTIRAVIVGAFTSGNVLVDRLTGTGGHLVCVELEGTLTAAASTGASSASTATASAVAAYEGVGVQPTSLQLIQLTTVSWSAGAPSLGELLRIADATTGVTLGSVMIRIDNGSMLDIEVALMWGAIANGNKMVRSNGSEATISAAPVQTKTPSLTVLRNLDGRRKELLGTRGDYQLSADAGKRAQFTFTMTGDPGATVNTPAVTTSPLQTAAISRLLGAIAAYGVGAEFQRHQTKRIGLAGNNNVVPNIDANRAGGSTGSVIVDRGGQFTVTVNQTHGAIDWEEARDQQTPVRVAVLMGTSKGSIVGIVIPNGQVLEANEGDSDGIATWDLTIQTNRVRESGDDEYFVVQL